MRPWGVGPSDGAALAAAWADPDVSRWTKVPDDPSIEAATAWVRGEERRRTAGQALDLVIAELGSPEHVLGEVGLVLVESERRWAEVGYWLTPEARGHGQASSALAIFAEWALREQPVQRLFARTDSANPRAGQVAERAGFTAAGTLPDGPQVWVLDAEPDGS